MLNEPMDSHLRHCIASTVTHIPNNDAAIDRIPPLELGAGPCGAAKAVNAGSSRSSVLIISDCDSAYLLMDYEPVGCVRVDGSLYDVHWTFYVLSFKLRFKSRIPRITRLAPNFKRYSRRSYEGTKLNRNIDGGVDPSLYMRGLPLMMKRNGRELISIVHSRFYKH
jgi:hypothetical protein